MMRSMVSSVIRRALNVGCACVVMSAASVALGAGFAINEQGASSAALGGAATARADLPERGFYNPAAYALSSSMSLSLAMINPSLYNQAATGTTESESSLSPVPALYGGVNLGDFGLGLSLNAPFGSGAEWPKGWAGRYDSQGSSLQVLELGASGAWRPLKPLAISAGVRLQSLSFETARAIDVVNPDQDASVTITGSDSAVTWMASALFMPIKPLTLGLSYRAGAEHAASGVADFSDVPIELESRAHDSRATTGFKLPGRLALGAAYDLGPGVLSLDVEYWRWSVVKAQVVDFEDEQLTDVVAARDWSDTFTLRAGYEHRVLPKRLVMRAGFFYDPTPAPAQTLGASSPDGDRIGATLGAGLALPLDLEANLSLGYTALLARSSESPTAQPGEYGGRLLVAVFGVAWTPEL